ncbi:MAG: cofactor-independent phosphoglycerate mutase [Methanoregulaceae archaeon]|jgi:2,3-bisphosphoglycerate-independent phosphoglycerate mutase|nr:cofactor-independent phosphoglycerate mutase [Methanoregulaceae archaeon]
MSGRSQQYLVILGDGMADEPLSELGGKTPLEYARTPNMDRIAREGTMGMVRTIPDGYEAGSDIANLGILGYDPRSCYTGRGPLEAASMGLYLAPGDIAYRCNLVTIVDGVMADFSAGHISSEEGTALFATLSEHLPDISLYPGVSYRNILVVHEGKGATTYPPHDIVAETIEPYLPSGNDARILLECMEQSRTVFSDHPVNRARLLRQKPPATQIWPWSGGKKPTLTPFLTLFGKEAGVISAVDLLQGIARLAGMEVIRVPGATGYLDTDYQAKAAYALDALEHLDFVYVHIEAADEAGHLGNADEKVKAIEQIDQMIGTVMKEFSGIIAVLPDHPTPIRIKTHTSDPVPFAIWGKGHDSTMAFSEKEGTCGRYGIIDAPRFLPLLFS